MHRTVADVMTRDVVAVSRSARVKEIVRLLRSRGVSALPVLDPEDHVIGVVSEADLLPKQELLDQELPPLFERRRRRRERARAAGLVAGELMTTPVVTIGPRASIAEAARTMHRTGVKRLPVMDDRGRLVGLVSRADLIKVFLRSDEEIQAEAEDQLALPLRINPQAVHVSVRDGLVHLTGRISKRSEIPLTVDLVRRIDGVVGVDNRLGFELDDEASERWVAPRHFIGP